MIQKSREVKVNDIIQLVEHMQKEWAACLMVVSEVRSWGVLAYIKVPYQGDAYLRVPFDDFEIVGQALLVHPEDAIEYTLTEDDINGKKD